MKQILLFTFLIISAISNSQKYSKIFFGDNYKKYKGLTVKLNPEQIGGYDYKFYTSLSDAKQNFNNAVAYPDPKYTFNTVKDSIKNKEFLVTSIIDEVSDVLSQPIFVLEEIRTKETIYFKYDRKYDFNFPFLVTGYSINEQNIADEIVKEVDDMEDQVTIASPYLKSMQILKYIKKGKTNIYLSLETYGSTLNVREHGVIVLFTDGTKWTKPTEKIDVDASSSNWKYSAFITLTPTDIALFSRKQVSKFRLYIYDESLDEFEAEKFKTFVSAVSKMK